MIPGITSRARARPATIVVALLLASCTPSLPSQPSPSAPAAPATAATATPTASPDAGLATQWVQTGSLLEARRSHSATLLLDGRVLVAGGRVHGASAPFDAALASVELFDPATGTWSAGPPMPGPRTAHRAIRLVDGRVLVFGGLTIPADRAALSTDAALFDPASNTWTKVDGLGGGGYAHAPLLLPDGRVLVAFDPDGSSFIPPRRLEAFDPAGATWSVLAEGSDIRGEPTAMLPDGTVLMIPAPTWAPVEDGTPNLLVASNQAWAFDPVASTWTALAPSPIEFDVTTTAWVDGGRIALMAEKRTVRYWPSDGTWEIENPLIHLNPARIAIAMDDGRVLFIGASDCVEALLPPELLDTELGSLRLAWGLPNQLGSSATLLDDGRVLVAGGELACPHDELRRGQIGDAYLFDPFVVPPLTP